MGKLSQQDKFIIENLAQVNEIIETKESLQSKLNSILFALAEGLIKEDW